MRIVLKYMIWDTEMRFFLFPLNHIDGSRIPKEMIFKNTLLLMNIMIRREYGMGEMSTLFPA